MQRKNSSCGWTRSAGPKDVAIWVGELTVSVILLPPHPASLRYKNPQNAK